MEPLEDVKRIKSQAIPGIPNGNGHVLEYDVRSMNPSGLSMRFVQADFTYRYSDLSPSDCPGTSTSIATGKEDPDIYLAHFIFRGVIRASAPSLAVVCIEPGVLG